MVSESATTLLVGQSSDLLAVIAQAHRLIQAQREALRQADLTAIIVTADALNRVAGRLSTVTPDEGPADCEAELIRLQHAIAHQADLVRRIAAATPVFHINYPGPSASDSRHSILLDQMS